MTEAEFVNRALGVPWVRWGSAWEGADCFGLLVLYFRHVLGVDLGQVPQTDIAHGFEQATGWQQCEPAEASCWMAFTDGRPDHCGLLLRGGQALHADGRERGACPRVTRLSALQRLYPDMRFYRYASC